MKYAHLFLTMICASLSLIGFAQVDTTGAAEPQGNHAQVLGQFSMGAPVGGGGYSVPKISINTFSFTALIGKFEMDFYLFNSIPTISINAEFAEQYFRNDFLKVQGGIVNICFGKTLYFANGKDILRRESKGGRFEFRTGAKAVDALYSVTGKREIAPVIQSTCDLSFKIPLFDKGKKGSSASNDQQPQVGNLSFRCIGGMLNVINSDAYNEFYSTRKGIHPHSTVFTTTFDMSFYVTNQIFINGGYSVTNEAAIMSFPFLNISYGKTFN